MGSLISIKIDVSKIDKTKLFKGKSGTYLDVTVSVNDDTNQFGQNVSAYIGQTKEEIEAKADKKYLGNGKVFWTNGEIKTAERPVDENGENSNKVDDDDLPF